MANEIGTLKQGACICHLRYVLVKLTNQKEWKGIWYDSFTQYEDQAHTVNLFLMTVATVLVHKIRKSTQLQH